MPKFEDAESCPFGIDYIFDFTFVLLPYEYSPQHNVPDFTKIEQELFEIEFNMSQTFKTCYTLTHNLCLAFQDL